MHTTLSISIMWAFVTLFIEAQKVSLDINYQLLVKLSSNFELCGYFFLCFKILSLITTISTESNLWDDQPNIYKILYYLSQLYNTWMHLACSTCYQTLHKERLWFHAPSLSFWVTFKISLRLNFCMLSALFKIKLKVTSLIKSEEPNSPSHNPLTTSR